MNEFVKKSPLEIVTLFAIRVWMTYFHLFDFCRDALLYSTFSFLKVEFFLKWNYLFQNPFTISKKFLIAQGEANPYAYGETPLRALDKIMTKWQILSKDTIYDLGCGRGRTSFWMHSFIGSKVYGIDWNPVFIRKAQEVSSQLKLKNINFLCQNFLTTDYQDATVIYLFGTCLEDETIRELARHFKSLKRGIKVITVSYSICEFAEKGDFIQKSSMSIRFPWGKADVYLSIKT